MAFRNAAISSVGTSLTTLYTCPASTEAVVHALYLSNKHATDTIQVTVQVTLNGGTPVNLIYNASILAGQTMIFDKPINLRFVGGGTADVIKVQASTTAALDAFASILETAAS
jgi:hypothetical protein